MVNIIVMAPIVMISFLAQLWFCTSHNKIGSYVFPILFFAAIIKVAIGMAGGKYTWIDLVAIIFCFCVQAGIKLYYVKKEKTPTNVDESHRT